MGEAKRRGTKQDRVLAAMTRLEEERILRRVEKRNKIVKTTAKSALIASLAFGLIAGTQHLLNK